MYRVGLGKKLLSFFWPVTIEKSKTEWSSDLEVIVYNGKLMLDTQEVNYSFGNLHKVMELVLLRLAKRKYSFEQTLILGYGGGSAAQIIHQKIDRESQIIGIEKDSEVIKLAKKYFYTTEVKLLHEDACDYVKKAKNNGWKYSIVVVDLFRDAIVPQYDTAFFESIYEILDENGVAVLNTMMSQSEFNALGRKIDEAGFKKEPWNEVKENRVWVFKPYAKLGATTKSLVP
jgi:spermidine synthase